MSVLNKISATYVITHEPTGVFYIGSTGNIRRRWLEHQASLLNGSHNNKRLQEVFTTVDDLTLEIVNVGTREQVRGYEQRWIDCNYDSELCCNATRDAENSFNGFSADERAKYQRKVFDSPKWQKAIREVQKLAAAANVGRVLSEEMLKKLAEGRAKKPHPRLGVAHSDEQKAKYMRSITEYRKTSQYDEFKNRVSDRLSKAVSIDGVIYKNPREAEEKLGINRNCIKMRLTSKNPKFKTWFRVGVEK